MFLENVDERTRSARRFREIHDNMISDLGGSSMMTIGKLQLIRRVATLAIYAEQMEMDYIVDNKNFNLDEYINISRTHSQLLKLLGLDRKQAVVESQQDLNTYIKEKYGGYTFDADYEVVGG